MKLVLLGPPGAGKGTQAELLSEEKGIPHISTGEMMRDAIDDGTDVGKKVKSYVEGGLLVPDDVMIEAVAERISRPDCRKGFLLDGFPRTLEQARALDGLLEGQLDCALYFDVDEQEVVERLSGRRACKRCGANYHLKYLPPAAPGVCDRCGGELYLRDDDKPETVRKRLRVYQEETAGLIGYYREKGLLREVAAGGSVEEVHRAVLRKVESLVRARGQA